MGCPAGIGPEILLKFLHGRSGNPAFRPLILGDIGVLHRVGQDLGLEIDLRPWEPGMALPSRGVPVYSLSSLDPSLLEWGQPTRETGRAMAEYILEAVRLCQEQTLAAMVTCPIGKATLNAAGFPYPGHTEMLAELTGCDHYRMMMAGSRLRVVLVTIHEPLARVGDLLAPESIADCIRMTHQALEQDFGITGPRIAVAGFNPHCGEQGMFGREEIDIIEPAVRRLASSCRVSGPWPPDTVFHQAAEGRFDAVVAMYHDQGLIPFKLLHFRDGVNVTLGLPIVRTSVDHGTAYDIAGRNLADPASLAAAWELAARIGANRARRTAP